MMECAKFVETLNKGIEGYILAYDQSNDECMLLVRHDGITSSVKVSFSIIEQQQEDAIYALRAYIRSGSWLSQHAELVLKDDIIVIQGQENNV